MGLQFQGVIGEFGFGIAILATIILFQRLLHISGDKFEEYIYRSYVYPADKNSRKSEETIDSYKFVYAMTGGIIWVVVICSIYILSTYANHAISGSAIDATCSSHIENQEELATTKTQPCQSDKTQKNEKISF